MPSRHADRRPFLLMRGKIKAAIRAWFVDRGFVEVEPGCLVVSPGNETHLHAFKTKLVGTDLGERDLYLHTSPEFAMKTLLAAGESKIFAFAPCFRNRERGALHAPEFTMLEWYRAEAPYQTLFDDCAEIMRVAAEAVQNRKWVYRAKSCDPLARCEIITLDQAFRKTTSIKLRETYSAAGVDRRALAEAARASGFKTRDDHSWSDIFSLILTEAIEPSLGISQPTLLCEYPIQEAALARPVPDDPAIAERFELYCCGIELANGFGELTDANVQRRRFETWMDDRMRIYGERYPVDEDFLQALQHMPDASGCALGFDRLAMLATGATDISQVLWTPIV